MMRFRRQGARRFRRRARPETYTLFQCRSSVDIWKVEMPCSDPLIVAQGIMIPTPATGGSDPTTAGATIGEKAKVVMGIKFQSEHLYDPSTDIDNPQCDEFQPSQAVFILSIWEALVVLPLAQGSKTLPEYLPAFTGNNQSFDVADRVLWKRICHLPLWGLNTTGSISQLESTIRDTSAGPQVVKSRVRIDDRHGLFYVRNYIHDQAIPNPDSACSKKIVTDAWFKVFFRVAFR